MKRLGLLAAAVALTGAAMFVPASPASAATVCVGQGNATLSGGIGVVGVHASAHVSFTFTFVTGNCQGLTASGTVWGHCGLSNGVGTTNTGHSFTFTGVGTELVVTGGVTGTVNAAEDPLDSGSCAAGTATNFIITGTVTLTP